MYNIKTLVAAASIAVATAAGMSGAAAAPWDHDPVIRHDRPLVVRERVFDEFVNGSFHGACSGASSASAVIMRTPVSSARSSISNLA